MFQHWKTPKYSGEGDLHLVTPKTALYADGRSANLPHAIVLMQPTAGNRKHTAAEIHPSATPVEPRKIVAQDNGMCLDRHNSDDRFAFFGSTPTPKKARPDIDTIHAWLPNTKRHWEAVCCVECHTPPSTIRTLALSHEILNDHRRHRRARGHPHPGRPLSPREETMSHRTWCGFHGKKTSAPCGGSNISGYRCEMMTLTLHFVRGGAGAPSGSPTPCRFVSKA